MIRVGIGYDIHPLQPGLPLTLGGIRIPHEFGLTGHSDADVVLHALMDSVLGAAALGDIGVYFPPDDQRYAGASSLDLLENVARLVRQAGWRIVNADTVVVAEAPRISPFAGAMQSAIAGRLGVTAGSISIKATTNEGLGPEGRGEAISARCVCLIQSTDEP